MLTAAEMQEFEDFLSIHATIAIVGPSGNGKTTAARKLLEAAGYNVHEMDCTDATMPHDIIGRQSLVQENGATVTRWNPPTRSCTRSSRR